MGVKSYKAKKGKKAPRPLVSVTVDAETMRFREPSTRDMGAIIAGTRRVSEHVPGLDPDTCFQVAILTTCYIPDPGEQDTEMAFGELAAENDMAFDAVVQAFVKEFPDFFAWMRERLKDDSPPESATSTTTPSNSSEDSPEK